jgi:homoserine O-acetyltransferase
VGFFLDDRDANNLLTKLSTWEHGDIGRTPGFDGSLERGQGHPHARREGPLLSARGQRVGGATHAERGAARDPPSVWGHFAGGGANPVDTRFINEALKHLLASS